eukprot:2138809-Prymnesium_polylepis.2
MRSCRHTTRASSPVARAIVGSRAPLHDHGRDWRIRDAVGSRCQLSLEVDRQPEVGERRLCKRIARKCCHPPHSRSNAGSLASHLLRWVARGAPGEPLRIGYWRSPRGVLDGASSAAPAFDRVLRRPRQS